MGLFTNAPGKSITATLLPSAAAIAEHMNTAVVLTVGLLPSLYISLSC